MCYYSQFVYYLSLLFQFATFGTISLVLGKIKSKIKPIMLKRVFLKIIDSYKHKESFLD